MLKLTLLKMDGRHTGFLKNIYTEHIRHLSFMDYVIMLYSEEDSLEHSTSWMIKYHFDQGQMMGDKQLDAVLKKADALEYWGSQLHILQCIPKLLLTPQQAAVLEPFVKKLLKSPFTFVRAAAFEAYFEIVSFFPDGEQEFLLFCKSALVVERASVIVKIRKILNNAQSKNIM